MNIILAKIENNKTINYALDELVRYLKKTDGNLFIDARVYDAVDISRKDIIWIGLDGSVEASEDDEIRIDVKNAGGIITGSNERAVLIAVYRFMYELGCRWIKPGIEGEIIPKLNITAEMLNVSVSEKASYRHRSICIEGGMSYEHICDVIEWLPKVGMNGYFVQFLNPLHFFKRWYNHTANPNIPAAPIDRDDAAHIWKRVEEEITKRGLMYHAVGHGWTCEPFGIPALEWDPETMPIPEKTKQYFAMLDGKRDLFKGKPINTSLCMTNAEARKIVADAIAKYAKENPDVKYLHVWLSDGFKNLCECEKCRDILPSDQYVVLLNEIDETLTAAGLDTKIVFLIYHELLWKPETEVIKNPDRFVMMFAPISRSYAAPINTYDKSQGRAELPKFILNDPPMPRSMGEFIAHLEGWQDMFGGDSFDFEYHLMWAHYADPGYMKISRVLHDDMAALDNVGLNGMVSCQVQRAAFPVGLPMYSMAKALWDKTSKFENVCGEYFTSAFGEDAKAVEEYLTKISDMLELSSYRKGDVEKVHKDTAEAKEVIARFKDEYINGKTDKNPSWKYLRHHAEACLIFADMLKAQADRNAEARNAHCAKLFSYIRDNELEIHNAIDSRLFESTINRYLPPIQ